MAKQTLNIQVGERITEVSHVVKHGKGYQIEKTFSFVTPAGSVDDGMILNAESYGKALTEQLELHGFRSMKDVVFLITSSRIAAREVTVPPVKDKQLGDLIKSNAADYFPINIDDYQITYTRIGEMTGDSNGHRVLVEAAPKSLLDSYAALAEAAGIHVEAIDTSLNALYQALKSVKQEGVTLYVNITPGHTECTALDHGDYIIQRSFGTGGDIVMEPLMRESGAPESAYIEAMKSLGPDDLSILPEGVRDQMKEEMERLTMSVARTVDLLSTRYATGVERIVLLGSAAHIPLFRESLKEKVECPILYLEEVEGLSGLTNSIGEASEFLACIGSSIHPVDLLPDALREAAEKKGGLTLTSGKEENPSLTFPIIIAVILAGAGALMVVFGAMQLHQSELERDSIKAQIAALEPAKKTHDNYVFYQDNEKGLKVITDGANGKNAGLHDFFNEMEAKMPSSILVLTATCTQDSITMNIDTPDFETAAAVISKLRDFDSFQVISVSAVSETTDEESGSSVATFTVTASYSAPEDENGGE